MLFLKGILKKFIQVGALHVIDSSGQQYTFTGKPGPTATIRFHNKWVAFFLLWNSDLSLGEGYAKGDITIEQGSLSDFMDICTRNAALQELGWVNQVKEHMLKPFCHRHQFNSKHISKKNISHHYDLNKELYQLFLDDDLQYSCAYFLHKHDNLESAQLNKKLHLAAKLRLEPGQKILDIGCGWGGLALYLAQHFAVEVTGLTLSEEQLKIAIQRAEQLGLTHRVRFLLKDYREEQGQYDRIVSVGMFEHVGVPHYPEYFTKINQLLTEDGFAVLHAIGQSHTTTHKKGFINQYIFPGGYCPNLSEVLTTIENSKLFVSDIEILHNHYAKTLHLWHKRFQAHRDEAKALYDEQFCRMWEYYLVASEFAFQNLGFMVFQIQLTRNIHHVPLTRNYMMAFEQERGKICTPTLP